VKTLAEFFFESLPGTKLFKRQSNTPTDELYNVFISGPIRVTTAPDKQMMPEIPLHQILSGDYIWAHLSTDFINGYNQPDEKRMYLNPVDAPQIGDKKPSIRADLIDREENFDFHFSPPLTEEEKIERPNSPVNNPALVSNVMLDTGEFVYSEVDLSIPGRGFDFVFARTYRSQSIYSGPLGCGLGPQLQQTPGRALQWGYYLL
jgi:hypothetical protein